MAEESGLKFIVFLGDGMADYPLAELGNRTPLQVARKPAMDRIARDGVCGLFLTVPEDMPPGSEVANLTVLGYDPRECYQGRGVIEAASMGVALEPNDIALRCNLICIRNGRIKNHSAGHISTDEAAILITAIDQQLGSNLVKFYPGVSYRHLCVLRDGSAELECAPPHDHVGEPVSELLIRPRNDAAQPTADLLNRMIIDSWSILAGHSVNVSRTLSGKDPANSLWFWSPGRKPAMKTYQEMFGITGAVISAVDLIRGLGVYAGFDVINVTGATGLIDTNYEGKADACVSALADHDFVFVHVEASDEASHSRDLQQKILAIEYLDSRLISRVMQQITERGISARIAVLPDHPTPVSSGNHIHGAVPVAIAGYGITPDSVTLFDEESVKAGSLGTLQGDQFIRRLLDR
ncbi:MAG: cofactor-independent phosphoglycerate mutase [candidate division WOR-3 bacterium]